MSEDGKESVNALHMCDSTWNNKFDKKHVTITEAKSFIQCTFGLNLEVIPDVCLEMIGMRRYLMHQLEEKNKLVASLKAKCQQCIKSYQMDMANLEPKPSTTTCKKSVKASKEDIFSNTCDTHPPKKSLVSSTPSTSSDLKKDKSTVNHITHLMDTTQNSKDEKKTIKECSSNIIEWSQDVKETETSLQLPSVSIGPVIVTHTSSVPYTEVESSPATLSKRLRSSVTTTGEVESCETPAIAKRRVSHDSVSSSRHTSSSAGNKV